MTLSFAKKVVLHRTIKTNKGIYKYYPNRIVFDGDEYCGSIVYYNKNGNKQIYLIRKDGTYKNPIITL